jgi:hypothetical protein
MPTLFAPGDTVTFAATVHAGSIRSLAWHFVPGDTLAAPSWKLPAMQWRNICPSGTTVCRIPPPAAGRMYVRGWVTGASIDFYEASEIVWPCVHPPPDGSTPASGRVCPPRVLTLTADPSRIETAGDTVRFTAEAPGSQSLEVLEWSWAPVDSAQQAQTASCQAGENPCVIPVHEAGEMTVTARVDGQVREATASVQLPVPDLRLDTSPVPALVAVGDTMVFTASTDRPANLLVTAWNWTTDDGRGLTTGCGPGFNPCARRVFEDGTMTVEALVNGAPRSASVRASVVNTCPLTEPYLADPDVIAGLRDMWQASRPGGPLADMREQTGYVVQLPHGYDVLWGPTLSDACNIHEPPDPQRAPQNVVAWVHTHPAAGRSIPPGVCRNYGRTGAYGPIWYRGTALGRGASTDDRQYLALIEAALGRSLAGIILEPDGLVRFRSNAGETTYRRCNAWQS